MNLKVGDRGVTVPKDMLGDVDEVVVRNEDGRIVIEPISQADRQEEDPLLSLGQNPVSCGGSDASENHDRHLYGG